jgi:hypothetical protein
VEYAFKQELTMADARSMAITLTILFAIAVPLVLLYRGATKTVTESLHCYWLIRLFVCTALAVTVLVIFQNPTGLTALLLALRNRPDG